MPPGKSALLASINQTGQRGGDWENVLSTKWQTDLLSQKVHLALIIILTRVETIERLQDAESWFSLWTLSSSLPYMRTGWDFWNVPLDKNVSADPLVQLWPFWVSQKFPHSFDDEEDCLKDQGVYKDDNDDNFKIVL